MKHAPARATIPLFFLVLLVFTLLSPVYADELFVSTNKSSYGLGATVNVYGTLTWKGNPVTDGLVAVQVEDRLGSLRLIRVVPTGTSPPPWKVRIVEFYSCDSLGNPKNSFNSGALAYFTVTVESLDTILERQVTVTCDLFDSVGVSIAVAYATFPVAPGKQITYLTSMPIPNEAFAGAAMACTNALTKLPKDGGQPYCAEESVEFAITGGTSQSAGSTSASSTSWGGSYSLSFKLPGNAMLGNYSVSTSARYNAWASTIFDYFWRYTDVNRDGKVNILDISIAATAFNSKAGDPTYNSSADINKDNLINILDITAIAVDYKKSRT